MKKKIIIFSLFFTFSYFAGDKIALSPMFAKETTDTICEIYAVVGDSAISNIDFDEEFEIFHQNLKDKNLLNKFNKKSEFLNYLIEKKLISIEAEKQKIRVSETEINYALEFLMKQNHLNSLSEFKDALAKDKIDYNLFLKNLRENIKKEKLLGQIYAKILIVDEDIKAYYEKENKIQKTIKIQIKQISSKDKKQISKIYEDCKNKQGLKEKSFKDDILMQDKGYFTLNALNNKIKDSFDEIDKNACSKILEKDNIFFLFFISDLEEVEDNEAFLEKKDQIKKFLYQEAYKVKYKKFLENLKKQTYIKIYENFEK